MKTTAKQLTPTTPIIRPVPKPAKGSAKAGRARRKQELERHRCLINEWVLGGDGYDCKIQAVGACWGVATHAHHVFGRGNSPDDDCEQPNARLAVCHPCHVAIHRAPGNYQRITQDYVEQCLAEAIKSRPEFAG